MTTDQMTDALTSAAPPEAGWLNIAAMLADLAFETDRDGRFTAFGPGKVLDNPAARLLGVDAASVLFPNFSPNAGQDPALALTAVLAAVCEDCVGWQGKVNLAPAIGATSLYRLSLAPRITAEGKVAGTYGLLFKLDAGSLGAAPNLAENSRGSIMLDADTGFWNAGTFARETARRFDRLDVEELPGTLLFLGFCRAPRHLYSAVAMRIADELREVVRPTDLLGRINDTTIALWCDGMDHLTGGERAARFCGALPRLLPDRAIVTAGVAVRWPGSADDPHTVMERAGIALRLADLATERQAGDIAVGAWRAWQND